MRAPKEVPWVVGLIAATLAWTLTHIVDRLTSAPLITYELERPIKMQDGPEGKSIFSGSFLVRNLTRQTVFNHARFQIYAGSARDPQGTIESVGASFIFPGESFQPTINAVREKGEFVLMYDLPEMQPHQIWRLNFSGLAVSSPALSLRMSAPPNLGEPPPPPPVDQASPTPSASIATNSPVTSLQNGASQELGKSGEGVRAVQLVKANWQTDLVENELPILAGLAVVFTILLVISLFFLKIPDAPPLSGPPPPIAPDTRREDEVTHVPIPPVVPSTTTDTTAVNQNQNNL
jgi:hypothetical protein